MHANMVDQDPCMPSHFSNSMSAADVITEFVSTCDASSKQAREICSNVELNVAYGDDEAQAIDVFYPKGHTEETGLVVFFHGGYWQEGSRQSYHFPAIPITAAGKIYIAVGKILVPRCSLTDIVEQCKRAMLLIASKFPKAKSLTICGHSSGGHECAMMMSQQWDKIDPTMQVYLEDKLQKVVLLCGVFEMTHLMDSIELNSVLHLTKEEALKNSPMEFVDQVAKNAKQFGANVVIADVQYDAPKIKEWNKIYYEALKTRNVRVTYVPIPDLDHYKFMSGFCKEGFTFNQLLIDI